MRSVLLVMVVHCPCRPYLHYRGRWLSDGCAIAIYIQWNCINIFILPPKILCTKYKEGNSVTIKVTRSSPDPDQRIFHAGGRKHTHTNADLRKIKESFIKMIFYITWYMSKKRRKCLVPITSVSQNHYIIVRKTLCLVKNAFF